MDKNLDQAKGKIKQAVGDLTGDKHLKTEGMADEVAGKIKEHLEDAKDKVEGWVDHVKDKVTKD